MHRSSANVSSLTASPVHKLTTSAHNITLGSPRHKLFKMNSEIESRIIQQVGLDDSAIHKFKKRRHDESKRLPTEPTQQDSLPKNNLQSRLSELSTTIGLDSRYFMTKHSDKQQAIRLYFVKMMSNHRYNMIKCFRKWKYSDAKYLQYGKNRRVNKWFFKAAVILAKNTSINLQKSLWRLMPNPLPVEVPRHQIRSMNMTVIPTEIIDFFKERDVVAKVSAMLNRHKLKQVVDKFVKNQQQCQIKIKFLRRVLNKRAQDVGKAFQELRQLAIFKRRDRMVRSYNRLVTIVQNKKALFIQIVKSNQKQAIVKKKKAAARILHMNKGQLHRYRKSQSRSLRILSINAQCQLLTARYHHVVETTKILQKTVQSNVKPLFRKPKRVTIDLASLLKQILERVYYRNVGTAFKRICGNPNKWYRKAARILALNSKISLQNSLWRMYDNAALKRQMRRPVCESTSQ